MIHITQNTQCIKAIKLCLREVGKSLIFMFFLSLTAFCAVVVAATAAVVSDGFTFSHKYLDLKYAFKNIFTESSYK